MVIGVNVDDPIIALEGPEEPDLELGVGGGIHNLGFAFRFFQRSVQAALAAAIAPIKHIYRKNQGILGVGLANYLILLIPKFLGAAEARKIQCGKYLLLINKLLYSVDFYDKQTWLRNNRRK